MWKKRYTQSLPLASLDLSSSRNYVIQNVSAGDRERQVITLLEGNHLGVTTWQGEFCAEKIFKIECCTDNPENCIVSAYGNAAKIQWVACGKNVTLEGQTYHSTGTGSGGGDEGEERLRPPFKEWRFTFEEISPDSKKYRIISGDDELENMDTNCLHLRPPNERGERQLGFTKRNDDDATQLWCLHQR